MNLEQACAVLGVRPGTAIQAAQARFRAKAKLLHPDRIESEELRVEANASMSELTEAWAVFQRSRKDEAEPRPTMPDPRGPDWHECAICGFEPAAQLSIRWARGFLYTLQRGAMREQLCRTCGTNLFRSTQASLMSGGWWSLLSAPVTLVYVVLNIAAIRQHVRGLPPPRSRASEVITPLMGMPPFMPTMWRRPGWMVSTSAIMSLLAIGIVAESDQRAPVETPSTSTLNDSTDDAPMVDGVGTCLKEDGAVAECGSYLAVWRIVRPIEYADECLDFSYYAVFETVAGELYCAIRQ